jgi:hypothetical protein
VWLKQAESYKEAFKNITDFGSCIIQNSKHCGRKGVCNCYCWNKIQKEEL